MINKKKTLKLLQAKAKLENYKGKETKWEQSEVELDKLKKQILLQGRVAKNN